MSARVHTTGGPRKESHMYVTTRGVTKTKIRRNLSTTDSWEQPMGQTSQPQRRESLISQLALRANSALAFALIVAVVLTGGLAVAVRTKASAASPTYVKNFGKALELGNPEIKSNDAVVAIASPKKASGYWIVTQNGRVFPFGDVTDFGSNEPGTSDSIVDMAVTPSGDGYWLMGSDGDIYTFGDATYYGTPNDIGIENETYVALIPSKSGEGYTLVTAKGTVNAFGDGVDFGGVKYDLGDNKIVDAAMSAGAKGYYMLGADGEIKAYGEAKHFGNASIDRTKDIAVAISVTDNGSGYWVLAQSANISSFGTADEFVPSEEEKRKAIPAVDLAVYNTGDGYWIASGKTQSQSNSDGSRKRRPSAPGEAAPQHVASGDVWEALRNCEAGGNYSRNSGNGYYGAYQFSKRTWDSMGTGYAYAHEAPPEVQDDAARRLQARSGWGQWPACSRKIGVR